MLALGQVAWHGIGLSRVLEQKTELPTRLPDMLLREGHGNSWNIKLQDTWQCLAKIKITRASRAKISVSRETSFIGLALGWRDGRVQISRALYSTADAYDA